MLTSLTMTDFLNETASSSPAPGGGSASALAASLGTALTSMVCRLTISKKKYANVQSEMEEVLKKSEELRVKFTAIINEDATAFNKVMTAFGLPKETDDEKAARFAAIQETTKSATLVPLKLIELCEEAIGLVKIIAEKGNQNSRSDSGVAALMIQAGCEGAALNVKINLLSIQDPTFVGQIREKLQVYFGKVYSLSQEILNEFKMLM